MLFKYQHVVRTRGFCRQRTGVVRSPFIKGNVTEAGRFVNRFYSAA